MYSAMGEAGILSAVATMNLSADVDQKGDVPSGCDSPYVVSVTNTRSNGTKYSSAAYGKNAIDLGAPGTSILSTFPKERTGNLTGTSMATVSCTVSRLQALLVIMLRIPLEPLLISKIFF